jgi:4-hydroxy-tetrahydrodipicolinate reductase
MGQRLVALTIETDGLNLVGAIEQAGHPLLGKDAGVIAGVGEVGVYLSDQVPNNAQVVVDFSVPEATRALLGQCVTTGAGMVVGTTGLTTDDHATLDEAANTIAVLQAPNMSLGVNLLFALAGQVAKKLGDDYDIEIVEAHHRFKKDAPSGTALGIAEAICEATGKDINADVVHGRQGDDTTRQRGQIGMHALRMGDTVGQHSAIYSTLGERIELTHVASNRDIFARGALTAAAWLADQPAGRYGMANVLDL